MAVTGCAILNVRTVTIHTYWHVQFQSYNQMLNLQLPNAHELLDVHQSALAHIVSRDSCLYGGSHGVQPAKQYNADSIEPHRYLANRLTGIA